ncbi:aspartate kinase [Eupransor demetentiae]|uniref:Aspartokinase n=1 Tax=Eupransor demetentiae TaxID=3109584 RepID=A0ABP0ENG1_9LACO|nr:Aspartate kinase (MetL1) [Lactobacillaceae bacterium LMG 33000]
MKVIKFGGSSLATGPQFQRVIDILQADPDRQVVVTSAPGKAKEFPVKVTDLLLKYADQAIADEDFSETVRALKNRYGSIAQYFHVDKWEIQDLYAQIDDLNNHHYPTYRYLRAAFAAHGEYLNAQLLTMILKALGEDARFMDPRQIHLHFEGRNTVLDEEATYDALGQIKLEDGVRYIFPGFFGYNHEGRMVTFDRGGSDITGAILAKGLKADVYENFTDVSAIYAVNPNLVDHPRAIHSMSYNEMRELSYAGFAVFHDEAIIPAIKGQIPINIKNTNDPSAPGTWIGPSKEQKSEEPITGIAASKHFAALYIHRYLLNKGIGVTLRLLQILNRHHVSYEHMPSGVDDLTIIFDRDQLNDEQIEGIQTDIQNEFHPDTMTWHDNFALIMIVGQGMVGRVGTLTEIVTPLKEAGISLGMVNQGASEISIMLGLEPKDADAAVQAIYHHFFDK